MKIAMKAILAGALAASFLSGCGNKNTSEIDGFSIAANIVKDLTRRKKDTAPTAVSSEMISAELARSDAPLVLVVLDKSKNQGLMAQIATNGRQATFANSQRESIVMRDGVIVATRGFGGDLMSSTVAPLERLVRSKSAGSAQITMNFLNAANTQERQSWSCSVVPGGNAPVALGTIDTVAQIVVAQCANGSATFSNAYLVASDGYVLSGHQWAGDIIGYIDTQYLRR